MAGSFSTGVRRRRLAELQPPCRPGRVRNRLFVPPANGRLYLLDICFYRIDTVGNDRWLATLVDDEGAPTTPLSLWNALVADGPDGAREAIERFETALTRAVAAGAAGDVDGVLALEPAFEELARSLEEDK
jgi:hypothetical protein